MIFLSIFICFYLFFFRRQRRNFLYRTHVKTSSCGTIERIERRFYFLTTECGLNGFFDHEFDELNDFLAFLAKAPSGWFPKSRQGSPNS